MFFWPFYNVFVMQPVPGNGENIRYSRLAAVVRGWECLMQSSNEGVIYIAELVCVYVINAAHTLTVLRFRKALRAHDLMTTKSLKGAVLDWITPRGQP